MELGSDTHAGDVSGEAASRLLAVVVRGYDRHQVDEHITELENRARQGRELAEAARLHAAAGHEIAGSALLDLSSTRGMKGAGVAAQVYRSACRSPAGMRCLSGAIAPGASLPGV